MSELYIDFTVELKTDCGMPYATIDATALVYHNDPVYLDDLDCSIESYWVDAMEWDEEHGLRRLNKYIPLPNSMIAVLTEYEDDIIPHIEERVVEHLELPAREPNHFSAGLQAGRAM